MTRTIMIRKNLWRAAIVSAFSVMPLACGGGDDAKDDSPDGDAKTPATCEAICAQQNRLCNTQRDCAMQCSVLSTVVTKTACQKEFQEGLECLSAKNVCDAQEVACPATSFDACIDIFCTTNTADPICAP